MIAVARTVPAGTLALDSYEFSAGGTLEQAKAFVARGVGHVYGYLGVINAERVGYILEAGASWSPVTLAGAYEGAVAVAQMQALGTPTGVHACLDVEGDAAFHTDPVVLAGKIDAFADEVVGARYPCALYLANPQPLTSDEIWERPKVTLYWGAAGVLRDRNNALAAPKSGYVAVQSYPSVVIGGVLVDLEVLGRDAFGRGLVAAFAS